MPDHSRNYIMYAAKSAHGTFSRPRAIPTYLPTLASDRALQKLYAMLPYFPNLLQDRIFSNFFQTTCDYILSTSTTRFVAGAARDPFSIYFRQVGR